MKAFDQEVQERIAANGRNTPLQESAARLMEETLKAQYSYNFSWLGRPIIQYPQDVIAMQELIFRVQPDLIIETGIAHGGSIIFSASMLALNALCGGPANAEVLAIDIDIRPHNRAAIEKHPMAQRITLIQGSSIAAEVVAQVQQKAKGRQRTMVLLDSNHTHEHVLAELDAYAGLTAVGSYCVVFDTIIEDMAGAIKQQRLWGRGNNPKTAVREYLRSHPEFEIDLAMDSKLLLSVAPHGFLRRVR